MVLIKFCNRVGTRGQNYRLIEFYGYGKYFLRQESYARTVKIIPHAWRLFHYQIWHAICDSYCMNNLSVGKSYISDHGNDFRERMMLQISMIEAYRVQQWETNSRALTPDEAAEEWIALFAAGFNHHVARK